MTKFHTVTWTICLLVVGCTSSKETEKTIELEKPRTSGGIILKDSPADWAERWSKMMAEAEAETSRRAAAALPPTAEAAKESAAAVADAPAASEWPDGSGKIFDLPRLSFTEISELMDAVVRRLQTDQSYDTAPEPEVVQRVPALPEGVKRERLLARVEGETTRVLRMGYWDYRSRTPQFVVYGATLGTEELSADPVVEQFEELLNDVLAATEESREGLAATELESQIIQLSYVDVSGAMSALKGLGYSVFAKDNAEPLPAEIPFAQLPLLVELPAPTGDATGLVAKTQTTTGKFGSTVVPTLASDMSSDVIASPTSRVMVLFHPAHPEQFSRIKQLLDEVIDRPARQVFLEGLVLEVSTVDFQELGIQWQHQTNDWDLLLGSLTPGSVRDLSPTLDLTGSKAQDFRSDWIVRVRSLIIDGKAEILSRPSVLTLNNRQATIRVGQDIPIVTSQEGISGNTSKISFDFSYLSLGIMLNIRPRISADGSEVSMMIDAMVSSRTPEADLEIRDENGTILASAPQVDSRRVQTYARIQNNTPFIIGGLVSRDKSEFFEKVPILGDLPLIGLFFRSRAFQDIKREVIIVITPYVLPENNYLSRALPKNDIVDGEDNQLFRDSRRIQLEDIADVSFLYKNQRFRVYHDLAQRAVKENFRLAETMPFRKFSERRLPGEAIIVTKIFYNVLRRVGAEEPIDPNRIAVLTEKRTGGYDVAFLESILARGGVGEDYSDFFIENPDRAIAITFHDPYETEGGEALASEPVPEMTIVDCPDRETWGRLMWEMNQPAPNGRRRYTVLLNREEDLLRLRLAVILKLTVRLNGAVNEVSLFNFIPGRMLEIPRPKPGQPKFLDAEIARYFFHTTHGYAATIQEIEKHLIALDGALRQPEFQHLLEETPLPLLQQEE